MSDWVDKWSKGVSLVSLLVGVIAASYAIPQDKELKLLQAETARIDNALKVSEAELKRLESSRQLSLQLYQEVKQVLTQTNHNPRTEEAMRVLIDTLAEDPFRWKLLQALSLAASDPKVKEKAEATATFFKEESEAPVSMVQTAALLVDQDSLSSINVDLFYCQDSAAKNRPLAEKAHDSARRGTAGRWRVRELPREINARPGYDVHTNVVRYERSEQTAANALMQSLGNAVGVQLKAQEIRYNTPNYVSAFFCAS